MVNIGKVYPAHIEELNRRARTICEREKLSGLVIHSGKPHRQFLDDMDYPFKVNPHFKAWLPLINYPNCWLIIDGINKPTLIYYQPVDFWHKVTELDDSFWTDSFEIVLLDQADKVAELLPNNIQQWAYIGEHVDVAQVLGMKHCNPDAVLQYLHFHRSFKTDYELSCLREANRIAVKGHMAAKEAFLAEQSELDILRTYLKAIDQGENDIPYPAIIALNENAAILHYMMMESQKPDGYRSFLIDAGAHFGGYASDITRTYTKGNHLFNELLQAMDNLQRHIIASMKPGISYVDLHLKTHQLIAQLLVDFSIANGTTEDLIEQGITKAFFPHGLGHMLGLQVHDVSGFSHDEKGTPMSAPVEHPFLRCTRTLEARQVLTVEPGFYIIDSLLNELIQNKQHQLINWTAVDELRPYGGIRIEDNVIICSDKVENMTRELGL